MHCKPMTFSQPVLTVPHGVSFAASECPNVWITKRSADDRSAPVDQRQALCADAGTGTGTRNEFWIWAYPRTSQGLTFFFLWCTAIISFAVPFLLAHYREIGGALHSPTMVKAATPSVTNTITNSAIVTLQLVSSSSSFQPRAIFK
jgi:hypothetical protein